MSKPGPDNVDTNEKLIVFLVREMRLHPDLEFESDTRHRPWGSSVDVSYSRYWWKLKLGRRRVTLLATHGNGQVVARTRRGRQVAL
jgi:hypothetical protein